MSKIAAVALRDGAGNLARGGCVSATTATAKFATMREGSAAMPCLVPSRFASPEFTPVTAHPGPT
jgi:hypothetical protein